MGETIQHFGYTWMHVLDQTCGTVLIWSNLCKSAIVLCEAPQWTDCSLSSLFLYFSIFSIRFDRWGHACSKVRPPTSKAFRPRPMGRRDSLWRSIPHIHGISMAYPWHIHVVGIHLSSKSWFDGGYADLSDWWLMYFHDSCFEGHELLSCGHSMVCMQIICNNIYLILGLAPRLKRTPCTCPYVKGQKRTNNYPLV